MFGSQTREKSAHLSILKCFVNDLIHAFSTNRTLLCTMLHSLLYTFFAYTDVSPKTSDPQKRFARDTYVPP